jgi:hypothetical protein
MPRPKRRHISHLVSAKPPDRSQAALNQATMELVPPVVDTRGAFLIASRCGWSPDGLIGEDGAIELKCPRPANHWATWREAQGKRGLDAVPAHHRAQLLHAFVVGAPVLQWIDWVSYCPIFPPPLRLLIIRVSRAECVSEIAAYREGLVQFLEELEEELSAMRESCTPAPN